MNGRALLATGTALLALSVPAAKACNITADKDAAVRMASTSTANGRDVLSVKKTPKLDPAKYGTHRVGDPWPSTRPAGTTSLRSYPR